MSGANPIPDSLRRQIPAMVASELDAMDDAAYDGWAEEYARRRKSGLVAFICALFGVHYAYLGRWGLFLLYLVTVGGFFMWWFVDLFRVTGLVAESNRDVAVDVLRDLRAVSR